MVDTGTIAKLQRLPDHRYRMNALLARLPGAPGSHHRSCERLWSESVRIDLAAAVPIESRRASRIQAVIVRTGPAGAPLLVDLDFDEDPSPTALRFRAQMTTLEVAVDGLPPHWGGAASLAVDPTELSDIELVRTIAFVLEEGLPPRSIVSPWCGVARVINGRLAGRRRGLFARYRALGALKRARRLRFDDESRLDADHVRGAVRTWWGRRERGSRRRCRVVLAGLGARALAESLQRDNRLAIVRVADEEHVYAPATAFPGERGDPSFVIVGPADDGILTEPADALILLPGGPVIDRAAAPEVRSRLIVELGESRVHPEADGILAGRRIDVLPDLMFSAGRALVVRGLVEHGSGSGTPIRTTVASELAVLQRTAIEDAEAHGRTVREQLYLRALANLHRARSQAG